MRGLLFREIRRIRNRNDLQVQKTLLFMYHIAEEHEDLSHPHSIAILNNFQGYSRKGLRKLLDCNYVQLRGDQWSLTPEGATAAANMYNQNIKNEHGTV